ncbi:MAG: class B sortase [Oscillospiraceae bacterium]|nr:class B sortase [Oscillospiraceae bacterium]
MKKIIKLIIGMLLIGVIAVSSFFICNSFKEKNKAENEIENIEAIVNIVEKNDTTEDNLAENKDSNLQSVYNINNDVVGWIKIDGTNVNYPVMQTKDRQNYYLKRDIYKNYSYYGTPYVSENCDIENGDNIIIYAHNMKDNAMFGDLEKYKTKAFYKSHKIIEFNTLKGTGKYEVVTVFKTVLYTESTFKYYEFTKANNEKEYNAFISKCKAVSFYNTGVSAKYGDKLITLSTCEYSSENSRLVVVAKKI